MGRSRSPHSSRRKHRSRSRDRYRSRSRDRHGSRSHRERHRRSHSSSSNDSDYEPSRSRYTSSGYRESRRQKSESRSRSRSRDHKSSKKSRKRRSRSRSRSQGRDKKSSKKSRRQRSRSRSRSQSKDRKSRKRGSRSQSKSRSRSRDRKSSKIYRSSRRQRSRSRSRSQSRSMSRTPSRSRSHSRERRSKHRRGQRARSKSRSRSWSRDRKLSPRKQKRSKSSPDSAVLDRSDSEVDMSLDQKFKLALQKQQGSRELSKDIANYSTMSPAERVRARLKAMLDKNIAAKESHDQITPTAMPTPEQLESLESDSFIAQSFQSQRTHGKQGSHSPAPTATVSRSQFHSHEVDPSEYEPQVVVLEDEGSNHTPDHTQRKVVDSDGKLGDSEVTTGKGKPVASKNQRWLNKLQKMRQKFTAPPTD